MSAVLPPLPGPEFAFLGLGSNVGDRLGYLQRAVDAIDADRRTRVDAVSSVYETEPVGGPEQGPFLNIALRVATRRSPAALLRLGAAVERSLGRKRSRRWGPRTIDVDILMFGQRTVARRDLEIPHPRLAERAFALIPLVEVAPGMTLPDGRSLTSLLARLAPIEGIVMVGSQISEPAEAVPSPGPPAVAHQRHRPPPTTGPPRGRPGSRDAG